MSSSLERMCGFVDNYINNTDFVLNRPSGTQLGKANPVWLTNGDVVEVGLENVGTCTNQLKYV